MHTSCAPNNHPANNMDETQKKDLALKVIKNESGVSELAIHNQVSRKFIYTQKAKATKSIDDAFDPKSKEIKKEKILFYLPITKSWICQFILVMILNNRGSYRGVIKSLSDLLDYQISIGKIHNVVHEHIQKSIVINNRQDLSNVKIGAHDELFHQNKPVLAVIDIPSLY